MTAPTDEIDALLVPADARGVSVEHRHATAPRVAALNEAPAVADRRHAAPPAALAEAVAAPHPEIDDLGIDGPEIDDRGLAAPGLAGAEIGDIVHAAAFRSWAERPVRTLGEPELPAPADGRA